MTPEQTLLAAKLERALARAGGTHTLDDVIALARAGRAQIWEAPGAVIVTEVVAFPQRVVLRLWLCAGDLDGVERLLPDVEQWGREQGATLAEVIGRPGWKARAKDLGYVASATVFEKELLS